MYPRIYKSVTITIKKYPYKHSYFHVEFIWLILYQISFIIYKYGNSKYTTLSRAFKLLRYLATFVFRGNLRF